MLQVCFCHVVAFIHSRPHFCILHAAMLDNQFWPIHAVDWPENGQRVEDKNLPDEHGSEMRYRNAI